MEARGPFKLVGVVIADEKGFPTYFERQDVTLRYREGVIAWAGVDALIDNQRAWGFPAPMLRNDVDPGPSAQT